MNWVFETYSNVYNVAMQSVGLPNLFVCLNKTDEPKKGRLSRRNR
jgi:hypothetical protein